MNVHHRVDGDGPQTLVLANSLGTTLDLWDPQLSSLAARCRVVRYDHRGHGGSPAPAGPWSVADLAGDALGLLDALQLDRVSFCGVSLGGAVGMWLAVHAPERIDRLVLACTSASFGPPAPWLERAATVREQGPEAIADVAVGRWFTPGFAARRPELVARFRAGLAATPRAAYAACCEAIAGWDFAVHLGDVRAPALVICGAHDPVVPPVEARATAAAVPGAVLLELDAAHLANVEQPDAFTDALAGHVLAAAPSRPGGVP